MQERLEHKPSVDLHVHYTEETVYSIIDTAKQKNVRAIALVGRLQISDNFDKFQSYGQEQGVDIISGVEYTVRINGCRSDLIALGFENNHHRTRSYFGIEEQMELNRVIAAHQEEFLKTNGFKFANLLEYELELLERLRTGKESEKAIKFCQLVVRSKVNAGLIEELKCNYNQDWQQVIYDNGQKEWYKNNPDALDAKFLYTIYFHFGKPGYIEVTGLPSNTIDAIHDSGGVVLYSPEGNFRQDVWEKLQDYNIDGIMGWHGSYLELPYSITKSALRQNMLILGGSDYHPHLNEWQVGDGDTGTLFISPRRYEELKQKLAKK